MNKIIAVVGMCGSGKSTVVNYLESLGYKKVYFGSLTFEKLKEENKEITFENERMMQKKIRDTYGMGGYALLMIPKIEELTTDYNIVIDGLYSWEELKILQEKFNVITIAIIVDKNIRYERLSKRTNRALDSKSALLRDIFEIEACAKAGPIAYANYFINNNSDINQLKEKVDILLKKLT